MPKAEINGIEMHYVDEGDGEPLVLLHGLGSSAEDWEFQIPALSRHYRVVAPCLRGFGHSEKPPGGHSIKTWSEDVVSLIRHLDLAPVHLLGFSMGGAISFQTVVDHPGLLRSLIIVNSLPSFELDHWTKYLMVLTRIGMAQTMGMPRLARYVAKRVFPAPAGVLEGVRALSDLVRVFRATFRPAAPAEVFELMSQSVPALGSVTFQGLPAGGLQLPVRPQ